MCDEMCQCNVQQYDGYDNLVISRLSAHGQARTSLPASQRARSVLVPNPPDSGRLFAMRDAFPNVNLV
jgi:hypothetical protein